MTMENEIPLGNNQANQTAILISLIGLVLLILSQLGLSMGYDFLMSQKPIDFTHWAMLLAAVLSFSLWFSLPHSVTKKFGLAMMTLGIGAVAGMCCIDFILWAAHDTPEIKESIFKVIFENKSINVPFLSVGPSLFYMGLGVATYGLFMKYKWEVLVLNAGLFMIGLGHMVFQNRVIPVIGSIMLFVGILSILTNRFGKGGK